MYYKSKYTLDYIISQRATEEIFATTSLSNINDSEEVEKN